MADVSGKFFSAKKVRTGVSPSSPGVIEGETLPPVNPPGGGLNSVGLTMPSAFNVANSPLTSNGSLDVTGAGTTAQYIRGDGSLASFPSLTGFVPYTGATQNVDLGEFGVEAGFVNLDTTPTNTPTTQGTIYWDDARSTAALIMNGTIQHIGQDTFFYVKNSTGSSIPKGTAVRFAGTDGASGHLLITPFLANGSVPSTYFMGVTAEVIANGAFGQVMHFGELEGINTSGYTAGSLLYASTTVAGGFQTAVPVAPNNIVLIAATINSKNNGAILVRPTYGSNINTDEGVKITSPATGQLLQLQAGGLWENKTLGQVIGGTSSQFLKGDGSLDSNVYALNSSLANYQLLSAKGQPNGYAGLDSNGKVPLAQINDALIGNVNFQGLWNAATNSPTLANPPAAGTKGYYYIVSTAGTFAGISFEVGDWIISNGSAWGKVDNTDAVSSVFGRTGNVAAANGDYNTSQVTENTNLYFTNARAIASVLTGYVSGAGTISAADTILSAIQKLNGNIGALVTGVSSVNGQTGVVTLTTTNIAEGTNLYYTEARVNANTNVAANTAARHAAVTLGTANGLGLTGQQLSLGLASAGVTGALSGTDWSTFNSKQQALNGTGFVKISGTTISYDNSTYLTTAAAASTYLPLAGGTMTGNINWTANDVGLTWSRNTDGAFIKFISVGDSAGESYLQIGTSDNGDEKIIFTQSSLIRVQVDTDGLLKNGSSQKYVFENGGTWGIAISGNAGTVTNGVVTTGSYSNPSWITALSWTKITDRPTTLAGYGITDAVPSNRTITINGTAQDLSANRTFNVGTVTSVAALTLGTSGTDLSSSVANGTTTPVITLNVPTASAANRGALSAADWTTFNNKQNALTNPVTGTGPTNYLPKFTGTSTIGNSQIFDDGTNVGIGTATPNTILSVVKAETVNAFTDFAQFSDNTNGLRISNYFDSSGIRWDFRRGTTSVISISQGNNVGIGTTPTNGARLQVSGTATFSSSVTAGSTTTIGAQLTSRADYASGITFINAKTDSVDIRNFRIISDQSLYQDFQIQKSTTLGGSTYSNLLYFAPSGAATFSSSVQTGGNVLVPAGSGLAWSGDASRIMTPEDNVFGALIQTPGGIKFNAGGTTPRMTILATGNVGIGTINPLAKATVRGGNLGNSVTMASSVFSVQANDQGIFMGSFNGTPNFGSWIQAGRELFDVPFVLSLQPNGGEVGIGTSSPSRKLTVQGAFTSNEQLLYLKQGDDFGFSFNLDAAVTGNLMIKGVNNGVETDSLLTIRRDNGNIGIGTFSPTDKLQMNGGKAIFATSNFNGTTAGGSVFVFSDDNNGGKIWAQKDGNQAWGYLALQPAGGNVLIGTSTSIGSSILQVTGDARISNVLLAGGAANIDSSLAVQISSTGSGTQKWFAANKNGGYGLIVGYSETTGLSGVGAYIRQVTSDPLFFVVNNTTTALTLASTGAATFSNQVGFGTGLYIDTNGDLYQPVTGRVFISAAAANVTFPSYGFYNDTGLGMYRESADTLAFATSGVKALTLASNQAATFSSSVDINGKTTITADAGNEQLVISRASNTNEQLIIGYHSSDYAQIQAVEQGVAYRPLVLQPNGGNVLIGTTTPNGNTLRVNGNTWVDGNILMDNSISRYVGFGTGTENPYLLFAQNGSILFNVETNDTYTFRRGGSSLVTFTGSGIETLAGGLRTVAPTGTNNEFWRLGRAVLATSADPEDRWIRVQLGTKIYDILAIDRGNA